MGRQNGVDCPGCVHITGWSGRQGLELQRLSFFSWHWLQRCTGEDDEGFVGGAASVQPVHAHCTG